MLFEIKTKNAPELQIKPVDTPEIAAHNNDTDEAALEQAELRRQMYERIARSNAIAGAEDNARRRWQGR